MQLTVTTFVSVDGVYQGPGGPDEDRRDGFDRGGWLVAPLRRGDGPVHRPRCSTRPTRSSSAGAPTTSSPRTGQRSRIRTTGGEPAQHAAEVRRLDHPQGPAVGRHHRAQGDLAAEVRELKRRGRARAPGPRQRPLVRFLLANDLVDRLNLLVFPVIVGAGQRFFPDEGVATGLALDESRTTPSGVTISVYRPTGRAEFGTAEVDLVPWNVARGRQSGRGRRQDLGEVVADRLLELVVGAGAGVAVGAPAVELGGVTEAGGPPGGRSGPRPPARAAAARTTGPCPGSSGCCWTSPGAALGLGLPLPAPQSQGWPSKVGDQRLELVEQLPAPLHREGADRPRHGQLAGVGVQAQQQRADRSAPRLWSR